eukprot:766209-Hanusia_phi.AAC.7
MSIQPSPATPLSNSANFSTRLMKARWMKIAPSLRAKKGWRVWRQAIFACRSDLATGRRSKRTDWSKFDAMTRETRSSRRREDNKEVAELFKFRERNRWRPAPVTSSSPLALQKRHRRDARGREVSGAVRSEGSGGSDVVMTRRADFEASESSESSAAEAEVKVAT